MNLLGVSEEARIRADTETQESWDVIINNKIPDPSDDQELIFFQVIVTMVTRHHISHLAC